MKNKLLFLTILLSCYFSYSQTVIKIGSTKIDTIYQDAVTRDLKIRLQGDALRTVPLQLGSSTITNFALNSSTNILTLTLDNGTPVTVNLSSLAGGGTADGSETKINAGTNTTVTGLGTIASPYVISATGGGSGEANTNTNVGSGSTIANTKVGVNTPLKSLVAGTNVTLSSTANEITINATGGGGSTTVVDNLVSTATADALSANQGRALKEQLDVAILNGVSLELEQSFTALGGEASWTLSNTPSPGYLEKIFIGGVLQRTGVGYTISGNVVTWIANNNPLVTGDLVQIYYNDISAAAGITLVQTNAIVANSQKVGIPTGGANNQVLTKTSATNFAVSWITPSPPPADGGDIAFAVSDETTALTTGLKLTFRMPYAMTLTGVRASLTTASVGSPVIADINVNGTTILSTKLSIDADERTSLTAASAAVLSSTSLANDAEITIDIDQVGNLSAGAGLKIYLLGFKN